MVITQGCYILFWTDPQNSTLPSSSCMGTYFPSYKPSKLDKQDMQDTAWEVKTNSLVTYSYQLLNMDTPVLADCNIYHICVDTKCCLEDIKRIYAVNPPSFWRWCLASITLLPTFSFPKCTAHLVHVFHFFRL